MRLTKDDIAAMLSCGVLIIIITELFCWAITGAYIGQ